LEERYQYGPFGENVLSNRKDSKISPFRFSTKYTDDETDAIYYGHRYYHPNSGKWFSRDKINEEGGVNLYGFVCNNPVNLVDILGLLERRFEVVVGDPWSLASIAAWSNAWGQPGGNATGNYSVIGSTASSSVTITSRNNAGGACNTVDKPLPSGTIILYLRNDCPGEFEIEIEATVNLTGTGPNGGAFGCLQVGLANMPTTVFYEYGSTDAPVSDTIPATFRAQVGRDWTPVATYIPTVSFQIDYGITSTGTAAGSIAFLYAIPVL
jgi:RHS repeat-associated protein